MTNSQLLLDASMVSDYLKSPKLFYWRWMYRLNDAPTTGIVPKETNKDIVFGGVWADFVHRFYQGVEFSDNYVATGLIFQRQLRQVDTQEQKFGKLAFILRDLMNLYNTDFHPADKARTVSELEFERDGFCGRIDGETVLRGGSIIGHECKATSRAYNLVDQIWYYMNSVQIKLYACARDWSGVVLEFAYKDPPHTVFRCPVEPITAEQKAQWWTELRVVKSQIEYALDNGVFLCNATGCNIIGKKGSWLCPYKELCDGNYAALSNFKPREEHLKIRQAERYYPRENG